MKANPKGELLMYQMQYVWVVIEIFNGQPLCVFEEKDEAIYFAETMKMVKNTEDIMIVKVEFRNRHIYECE